MIAQGKVVLRRTVGGNYHHCQSEIKGSVEYKIVWCIIADWLWSLYSYTIITILWHLLTKIRTNPIADKVKWSNYQALYIGETDRNLNIDQTNWTQMCEKNGDLSNKIAVEHHCLINKPSYWVELMT